MTTKILPTFKSLEEQRQEIEWLEARLEVIEYQLFWYDTNEHCEEAFVKNLYKEKEALQKQLVLLKTK